MCALLLCAGGCLLDPAMHSAPACTGSVTLSSQISKLHPGFEDHDSAARLRSQDMSYTAAVELGFERRSRNTYIGACSDNVLRSGQGQLLLTEA